MLLISSILHVCLIRAQIIQDINALKRLLRAAEMDYHALYRFVCVCVLLLLLLLFVCVCVCVCVCVYVRDRHSLSLLIGRCYLFLCSCGNGKLLLACAMQEAQSLPSAETLAVLKALQIYTTKSGFGDS